jgi:hypothetical protein
MKQELQQQHIAIIITTKIITINFITNFNIATTIIIIIILHLHYYPHHHQYPSHHHITPITHCR